MKLTCSVETRGLHSTLGALQDALISAGQPGDAANIVEQECRLLMKEIIGFTPPKNAKQGKDAIRRDITRTMRPFQPLELFDRRPDMAQRLENMKKNRDVKGVRDFLAEQQNQWARWRVEPFSPRLHRMNRGSRGRVQSTKRVFVLEQHEWEQYVAMMEKRAGRFKASWADAYTAHLGKVAPWIERHLPSPKSIYFNGLSTRNLPHITFGSSAKDAKQLQHIIKTALWERRQKMERRIKLILSGYAKDVAAGMRPKRKTQPTAPDPETLN